MGARLGIIKGISVAGGTAFNRVELAPAANRPVKIHQVSITLDGPPNSSVVGTQFDLQRMSTVGTGTPATIKPVREEDATALQSTGLVNNTADGTTADLLHGWFVPVIGGLIIPFDPDERPDCSPGNFMGVQNVAALDGSRKAATYMVFEE
ncbi:hypothetical protein LCGC14_0427540 [marine sediment metagenome]|uniref:Uncharacterized protein n=1 Tax=marine sediment metagenome TaxID=412755 RepID=A0A0F9SVC8_9ZZZZ